MTQSEKVTETETPPKTRDEVALQFLKELKEIFEEQTLTNEDMVLEVCSLIDEWREYVKNNDDISYPELANDYIPVLKASEDNNTSIIAHDARLLAIVQNEYLMEVGISEEEYANMDAHDKIEHRGAITEIYMKRLREKLRKKTVEKFSNGPFGSVKIKKLDAGVEQEWFNEQFHLLNEELNVLQNEINEIQNQSSLATANSMTKARNSARLKELGLAKKSLSARLNHYKLKLTKGNNSGSSKT